MLQLFDILPWFRKRKKRGARAAGASKKKPPAKKRPAKKPPRARSKAERIAQLKRDFLRIRNDQSRDAAGDRKMMRIENELAKLGVHAKRVGFQKNIRWVKG